MVGALGSHERLTRGHTERVRAHADLIGEELGLSSRDREMLHWAAMVHDIGKLTVPPEVLNKDGHPTDQEWAVLRQHLAAGGDMLEPLAPWLGEWRFGRQPASRTVGRPRLPSRTGRDRCQSGGRDRGSGRCLRRHHLQTVVHRANGSNHDHGDGGPRRGVGANGLFAEEPIEIAMPTPTTQAALCNAHVLALLRPTGGNTAVVGRRPADAGK